jgi:hypothetical protein
MGSTPPLLFDAPRSAPRDPLRVGRLGREGRSGEADELVGERRIANGKADPVERAAAGSPRSCLDPLNRARRDLGCFTQFGLCNDLAKTGVLYALADSFDVRDFRVLDGP